MEVKNKMKRKIIFLDLDGTLFDVPRGLYEPTIKTRETISKLKKKPFTKTYIIKITYIIILVVYLVFISIILIRLPLVF